MGKIFSKQRGLFLVLFVIVLAVLMAVVIFGNSLSSVGKRADTASKNRNSFAVINAALAQFLQLNLRLPCPANATLDPTSIAFGKEDTVSPTDTTTCQSQSGVVPWNSLELLQPVVLDAWGRMISYRVYDGVTGFTRTNGLNLSDCLDSDVGLVYTLSVPEAPCNTSTHEYTRSDFFYGKGLTVNDRGAAKNQVAYALISHGASGYGAFAPTTPPTRLTMPESTSKEFLNADKDGSYWILNPRYADVSAEDENHFDDVVSYAVASDLVVAAKVGGRAWPLAMTLDRTDPDWPSGSTVLMPPPPLPPSPKKILFYGGPIMMSAYKSGAARYIASIQHSTYNSLGAKSLSGGSGDLSDYESLGFDFRVKRSVLKLALTSFKVDMMGPAEQVQFTFYDGTTQIGQQTKLACGTSDMAKFDFNTITLFGKEFTKVDIQALNETGGGMPPISSSFSVASIAACKYDDASHPPCALLSLAVTPDSCS